MTEQPLPQVIEDAPSAGRWKLYAAPNGKPLALEVAAGMFVAKYERGAERAWRDQQGQWWLGPLGEGER